MTLERSSTSSSDILPATPRRRFPIAALAALALVGLFEVGFVWGNRYRLWDANYILLEKKRDAMIMPSKPDDVAILGSSRFYHLDPKQIQSVVGENAKVTNYAWGWCGMEAYEGVLRSLINAGRTPKIILVDGTPEIFTYADKWLTISKSETFRVGYTETVPFWGAVRTTIGLKEWATTWKILQYYMTPPSARYRERVLRGLRWLWKTKHLPPLADDYERLVTHWTQTGWFMYVEPADKVAPYDEFLTLERIVGPYVYRKNKSAIYIFERFLRLAEENNIRIIMLPIASNPLVFEKFKSAGIYNAYDTWLKQLNQEFPNFSALSPTWFTWPGLLGDAGHVNAQGATRHMDLVIDILRQELTK